MTEETSTAKRGRGRPRLNPDERSTELHVRVPRSVHDKIDFYAGAAGMSVSEYVRQAIIDRLAAESALSGQ